MAAELVDVEAVLQQAVPLVVELSLRPTGYIITLKLFGSPLPLFHNYFFISCILFFRLSVLFL